MHITIALRITPTIQKYHEIKMIIAIEPLDWKQQTRIRIIPLRFVPNLKHNLQQLSD